MTCPVEIPDDSSNGLRIVEDVLQSQEVNLKAQPTSRQTVKKRPKLQKVSDIKRSPNLSQNDTGKRQARNSFSDHKKFTNIQRPPTASTTVRKPSFSSIGLRSTSECFSSNRLSRSTGPIDVDRVSRTARVEFLAKPESDRYVDPSERKSMKQKSSLYRSASCNRAQKE